MHPTLQCFPSRFANENFVFMSHGSTACYAPCSLHTLRLKTPILCPEEYKLWSSSLRNFLLVRYSSPLSLKHFRRRRRCPLVSWSVGSTGCSKCLLHRPLNKIYTLQRSTEHITPLPFYIYIKGSVHKMCNFSNPASVNTKSSLYTYINYKLSGHKWV
jgi:hypothetical protein